MDIVHDPITAGMVKTLVDNPVAPSGLILKQQLITATGNWTRPAKMAGNTVWLTMIGGGASGRGISDSANNARGGNGGQYRIRVPVDIGDALSVTCTIGGGGTQVGSNAQSSGGVTSFGAFLSVLGGSPVGGGAPGGSQVTGNPMGINGADTPLGYGGRVLGAAQYYAVGGGGLNLGTAPPESGPAVVNIIAAQGYGAGGYGQGGSGVAGAGYAGVPGAILVEWPEFV